MRFNKLELIAIASQTSLNFDREGILVVKERQEGFFRRSEICTKRWFRLRGNLLFYLRGREQCSEPMGVIVLEHFTVQPQPQDDLGHWPFQIVWDGGICYKLAAFSKLDRASWLKFIQMASYEHMRLQIITLQERLERIKPTLNMDIGTWREIKGVVIDMNEVPLCELSLSCDNLLCDAYGRPPSPMITVHVQYPNGQWVRYASTEVIEMCSNPSFSRTIIFRSSDGLTGQSLIKIAVYNMREQLSQTAVPMGFADLLLSTIQDTQRLRITLNSHNKDVGFVTLNCWSLEPSYYNGASPKHGNGPNSMDLPQKPLSHRRSHSLPPRLGMKLKLPSYGNAFKQNFANPYQVTYRFHSGLGGDITVHEIMAESKLCFQMPINLLGLYIQREKELLQEVICMGELGGQWKFRQMELLDTHLSLLKHYSHARQSLQVFLQSSSGKFFKPSSRKDDSSLEFAPVNLHLQRIWAHNDTLNKSGFHDIVTVGAFTAHTHKAGKAGGLIRLVQELKDISSIKAPFNSPSASRVQMACDAVQAIKQLRGEIVDIMAKLLALAKVKQSTGMMQLAEDMIVRTRTLLTLWDPGLVEEALSFIDRHKMHQPVGTNLPGIPIKDRPQHLSPFKQLTDQLSKLDLRSPELEDFATPCTPNLNKMVWPSNDAGKLHISAPSVYSAEDSNSKNVLENMKAEKSNIKVQGQPVKELEFHNDHFDKEAEVYANLEQFHSLNFHKTSNDFYQSSPIDQPFNSNTTKSYSESPDSEVHIKTSERRHTLSKHSTSLDHEFYTEKISETNDSLVFQMSLEENGNVECKQEVTNKSELDRDVIDNVASNDPIAKQYLDVTTMTNSPSANYYQPSDEPEPWDLTQLNIEASVMCLVSKVKFLCGRCGSPAIRLRNQKSVQAISVTKDQLKQSYDADHPEHSETKIESNTKSNIDAKHSTYMSAAMDTDNALNAAVDTVQKVVKKGNKFTDGLKLSEVYEWSDELRPPMRKLRQAMDGLLKSGRLAHAVLRLRCESVQRTRAHAALQVRRDTCFSQALTATATGLLCWFWTASQDMIVPLLEAGLGPLCSFEGLLSLYRSEKAMWGDMVVAIEDLQTVLFTLINSNRGSNIVPHVTGSRCAFNVLIPVPDSLYAKFNSKQHLSFTITAVFFNVGINEKATVAEALGETVPQEQSNTDNFDRLNKYYNTYKRIFPADYTNISRASSRVKPLEEVMENLKVAVQRKAAKNVEILQLAALATRQMNGIRVTSCKSAKDRTGMSVTLEQCTVLANEYHLAEHEFEKALNCMRSEGCRRENAYKNIGVKKYAFNKLQILALPKKYRPPHGSYGSSQT